MRQRKKIKSESQSERLQATWGVRFQDLRLTEKQRFSVAGAREISFFSLETPQILKLLKDLKICIMHKTTYK